MLPQVLGLKVCMATPDLCGCDLWGSQPRVPNGVGHFILPVGMVGSVLSSSVLIYSHLLVDGTISPSFPTCSWTKGSEGQAAFEVRILGKPWISSISRGCPGP